MTPREGAAQLNASNVTIERAGSLVLRDVSLTIGPGDRIGLVGPNGVGKSTLLAVLAGRLAPSGGSVGVVPAEATVGLLGQELDVRPGETIAGYVARRIGVTAASEALDRATDALAAGGRAAVARHQAALEGWMRLGGHDFHARLDGALAEAGLGPVSGRESRLASSLSGGKQPGSAWPPSPWPATTSSCSTSRPTTSTCPASSDSSTS